MHTPCVLALLLTSWNVLSSSSDITSHSTDRVAISIAFAIIVECLFILSLPILAWAFVLPGIIFLGGLGIYRVFLGVKDINMDLSNNTSLFSSSIT